MGTFGTGILENDQAMDIYYSFQDQYYIGIDLEKIKSNILKDFNLVDESNNPILVDNTNFWFAFAFACWECQSLDVNTLNLIEKINMEEIDSDIWEEKWEERKKVNEKLLKKISNPVKKIKSIPKFINLHIPMKIGECFSFKYSNEKYGGAICLDIVVDGNKPIRYVYGVTRIEMDRTPTLIDFINSHFLVYNYGKSIDGENANWINNPEPKINYAFTGKLKIDEDKEIIMQIKEELNLNQSVGFVSVVKSIDKLMGGGNMCFDFSLNHENQFFWEIQNPNSIDFSYPVSDYCKLIND